MPLLGCAGPEVCLIAGRFGFFFDDPGMCHFFPFGLPGASDRSCTDTLRAEYDFADGVYFPDGGHAALQARRPWGLPDRMVGVEEERAIDLNRNRRLIKVVTGAG
jgi:hypothetical protein